MSRYLLRLVLVMLVCLPAYLLIRRPWRFSPKRETVLGVFVLFMLALLSLALEGEYGLPSVRLADALRRIANGEGINFVPFRTIRNIWRYTGFDTIMVNLTGNVIMFLPWGFGLPLLWKRFQSPWAVAAASLLLTFLIESIQLFIGRSVDVDDLILNFLGGCCGGLLCLLSQQLFPKLRELEQ